MAAALEIMGDNIPFVIIIQNQENSKYIYDDIDEVHIYEINESNMHFNTIIGCKNKKQQLCKIKINNNIYGGYFIEKKEFETCILPSKLPPNIEVKYIKNGGAFVKKNNQYDLTSIINKFTPRTEQAIEDKLTLDPGINLEKTNPNIDELLKGFYEKLEWIPSVKDNLNVVRNIGDYNMHPDWDKNVKNTIKKQYQYISTIGDGTCAIHSFLMSTSKVYRESSEKRYKGNMFRAVHLGNISYKDGDAKEYEHLDPITFGGYIKDLLNYKVISDKLDIGYLAEDTFVFVCKYFDYNLIVFVIGNDGSRSYLSSIKAYIERPGCPFIFTLLEMSPKSNTYGHYVSILAEDKFIVEYDEINEYIELSHFKMGAGSLYQEINYENIQHNLTGSSLNPKKLKYLKYRSEYLELKNKFK